MADKINVIGGNINMPKIGTYSPSKPVRNDVKPSRSNPHLIPNYHPTIKPTKQNEIIDNLWKTYDKNIEYELKLFNNVFNACLKTIELSAKESKLYCVFEIPKFTFSNPPGEINIPHCATFIQTQLKKRSSDFQSDFIEPNKLIISWFKKIRV